jgi:formylglycine-generating enzyme required for sulfatase activity
VPASAVFTPPPQPVPLTDAYRWWSSVPGTDWRHPRGPGSDLTGLADHPVVHVAWPDIVAYAEWTDRALPTEAEWEFAARAGQDGAEYAWGDELTPAGTHLANVWQGDFPVNNRCEDGYVPVRAQLLPPLPARGAAAAGDRQRHLPTGPPVRRAPT